MSLICEESHLCFGAEGDVSQGHRTSPTHLCFGRRYRPQLDALEACAVASVLQDAVHELAILGKGLPVPPQGEGADGEGAAPWDESFRNVDERFGQAPRSARKYPEMAGLWSPRTEAMLSVQRHRGFAEAVLDEVLGELHHKGSFGSLRASVDWQTATMADADRLLDQHRAGLEKRRQLSEQIAKDRSNMLGQYSFWEEKAELLTTNLHDTHLMDGLTISYADAWEHNRREQQGLVLGRKEDALHEAIEKIQDPDGPNEERVHAEIMNFLARDIEIVKKDLDHWTDLYDAEMIQRETENMQLRNALEQQREEHRELREEEWYQQKIIGESAAIRAAFEAKKKVLSSVVAIQAWWRGVSFRAGISMAKPKKGKKGKKKGKKGKKKKKGGKSAAKPKK